MEMTLLLTIIDFRRVIFRTFTLEMKVTKTSHRVLVLFK